MGWALSYRDCIGGASCLYAVDTGYHDISQGDRSWVFGYYEIDPYSLMPKTAPSTVKYEGGAANGQTVCMLESYTAVRFDKPVAQFHATSTDTLGGLRTLIEKACDSTR